MWSVLITKLKLILIFCGIIDIPCSQNCSLDKNFAKPSNFYITDIHVPGEGVFENLANVVRVACRICNTGQTLHGIKNSTKLIMRGGGGIGKIFSQQNFLGILW